MAKANSIAPFPPDIDRNAFGNWLSGFTDGEGCFTLKKVASRRYPGGFCPAAGFRIVLRADDGPVLLLAQSFWNCGRLILRAGKPPSRRPNAKPQSSFRIEVMQDLASVIVPHFEKYPLRAKKAADFVIWRQAVLLAWRVQQRFQGRVRSTGRGVCATKWALTEKKEFSSLVDALSHQRRFDASLVRPFPAPTEPTLLDGLSF